MTSPVVDIRGRAGAAEWRLLVLACRSDLVALGAAVAEQFPSRRAEDWAGFLSMMEAQRTGPLAASALLSVDAGLVPDDLRAALWERVRVGELRAGMQVSELVAILEAFEARGIAAIAHKGPALSALAYGRTGARDSVDLDLVVRVADAPAADEALHERGYRRFEMPPLSPRREAAWRRTWSEYEYVSHDGLVFVDLHWRMCPPQYPFRVDPRRLWSRPTRTVLGGREVLVFPIETLIVLLCLHGAKHRWRKLVWLCDIDRLVRGSSSIDWEEIRGFTEESHSRRAVGLGLLLANRLLGTPLPAPVATRLAHEETLASLAAKVESCLAAGGMRRSFLWEHFDVWPFDLEVLDDWRDRARYLGRTLVIPTLWDWERIPLPDPLHPLYYLLRPLRLLAALIREAARRSAGRRGRRASGAP
jgi:hypothetical protein